MNNTLSLGIFYALIYFRGLGWTFSAETMSIMFATWIVAGFGAFVTTMKLYWAIPNIIIYPLSILLVYLLETQAHWT